MKKFWCCFGLIGSGREIWIRGQLCVHVIALYESTFTYFSSLAMIVLVRPDLSWIKVGPWPDLVPIDATPLGRGRTLETENEAEANYTEAKAEVRDCSIKIALFTALF